MFFYSRHEHYEERRKLRRSKKKGVIDMNTNITRNYFRSAAIAAVLTVSSASAQQPMIAPQGTVVYIMAKR